MASIKFLKDGTYQRLDKFTIMQLNEQGVINQTLHDLKLQEADDGLIYIYYKGNTIGEGMETGPRYGAIVTNLDSLGILEGETGGFRVKLSKRPTSDQIVEIVSNDSSIASISPSTLTFTSTTWNVEQTVTVTTVHDSDDEDASTLISLTTTNSSKTIPVNVADVDEFFGQILLSDSTLTIDEAGSGTFTVKLDQKPTNNQIVNVAGNNSLLSLSPISLAFTPQNWNVEQTVTINAADDEDSGNKQTEITLTTTNSTKTLALTIKDNDLPTEPEPDQPGATYGTVLTSHGSIAIAEGDTFTLQVKLKEQPSGVDQQLVILQSGDDSLLTINPSVLYFTPANYNVAQDVTLTALSDNDEDNAIVSINLVSNDSKGKMINANIRDTSDNDDNYEVEPTITTRVYNNRTIDSKWREMILKKWRRIPVVTRQYMVNNSCNILIVDPEQDSTVWVDEAGQDYNFTNVAGFTSARTTYLPTRESSIEASATHEMGHMLINTLKSKSSKFSSAWSGTFAQAYNEEKANVPFLMDQGSETNFNHHTKNTTEYYPEIFEYIIEKRIPVSVWLEKAPKSYQLCRDMIDLKYN